MRRRYRSLFVLVALASIALLVLWLRSTAQLSAKEREVVGYWGWNMLVIDPGVTVEAEFRDNRTASFKYTYTNGVQDEQVYLWKEAGGQIRLDPPPAPFFRYWISGPPFPGPPAIAVRNGNNLEVTLVGTTGSVAYRRIPDR